MIPVKFTLRRAEARDRLPLEPLEKELFLVHKNAAPDLFQDDPPYFTGEYYASLISDPDRLLLIAETGDGTPAGFLTAYVRRIKDHPILRDQALFHVDDLFVGEAFRGKGIGKALTEEAKRDGKRRGCEALELGVYAFNRNAIAFYEAMGMEAEVLRMRLSL